MHQKTNHAILCNMNSQLVHGCESDWWRTAERAHRASRALRLWKTGRLEVGWAVGRVNYVHGRARPSFEKTTRIGFGSAERSQEMLK